MNAAAPERFSGAADEREPHLLVCVLADERAASVIERGREWHGVLGGSWSVVVIETPATAGGRSPQAIVHEALQGARSAGASTLMLGSAGDGRHEVVAAIVQRARREHATAVLVDTPRLDMAIWRSEGERLSRLVEDLAEALPDLWVCALSPPRTRESGAAPALAAAASRPVTWLRGWPDTLLVLVVATLVAALIEPWLVPTNLLMVYLTGVVWVALRHGGPAALTAMLGSVFLFDLVFVPPRWSLTPIDPQYYVTFLVMLLVGLVISELATRLQRQAAMSEGRAQRSHALNRFALELVQARSAEAIGAALVVAAGEASGGEAWLCLAAEGRLPARELAVPEAAAQWPAVRAAWERRQETGSGTVVEPQAAARCIPLVAGDLVMGVLGVPAVASAEDRQLLSTLAHQAAVALERAWLDERTAKAAWAAETERLRSTLLAGLSHDFRTPLTAIVGNASTLLEQGSALSEDERRNLLQLVMAEARRMTKMANNLLELTRLQEPAVRLDMQWCPADELVAEALARRDAGAVMVEVSPELVLWCDPGLVAQLIANLVDNALLHGGGADVRLHLAACAEGWMLQVRDRGPGLPADAGRQVFDLFWRGDRRDGRPRDVGVARARRGTGVGLALCAAIVRLHGGRIDVRNDGGAVFEAVMPQPAARPAEGETA